MSDQVNFQIDQYATFETTVFWKSGAGVAIDMTDYTAKMQLRQTYDDTLILELDETDGITITEAAGQMDIVIDSATTGTFDFVNCKYDLVVTSQNNVATRVIEGICTLDKGVTHEEA